MSVSPDRRGASSGNQRSDVRFGCREPDAISHARSPPSPDVTGSFRDDPDESHSLVERGTLRLNQLAADGLIGTVLGIVITAIVGFVGLTAMEETQNATNVTSGQFSSANDALVGGINTAYQLLEVAFIVVILGVVIAALVGLRGRRAQ